MFCFYFTLWAESMKYMYYIFCIINLQVMLRLNYHIQYHESETSTDGDDAPERYGCHQRVNNGYFIQNTKLKSSLCRNYSQKGFCLYGHKCQFAHGIEELRFNSDESVYKTKVCHFFDKNAYCPYGPRCNYLHTSTNDRSTTRKTFYDGYREIIYGLNQKERSRLLGNL